MASRWARMIPWLLLVGVVVALWIGLPAVRHSLAERGVTIVSHSQLHQPEREAVAKMVVEGVEEAAAEAAVGAPAAPESTPLPPPVGGQGAPMPMAAPPVATVAETAEAAAEGAHEELRRNLLEILHSSDENIQEELEDRITEMREERAERRELFVGAIISAIFIGGAFYVIGSQRFPEKANGVAYATLTAILTWWLNKLA